MENIKADTIYKGHVITLDDNDTRAEAIGVKNGKILFIGSIDESNKFIGKDTKLIDLGDNYIYPGFIESHAHGTLAGSKFSWFADMSRGKTIKDYVGIMRDFMEDNPGRDTYIGNGCILTGELPDYKLLDELSKDVCIYIQTEDGHTMWVNSKVLEMYKNEIALARQYQPDTVDVDKDGNPTGILSDTICMALYAKISEPKYIIKQGLMDWQTYMFSQGFTAAVDAAVVQSDTIKSPECYFELAQAGKFKLRTYACYFINEILTDKSAEIAKAKYWADKFNCEYFKINSTKFFIDGVVEAHTAGLIDDYSNTPGNKGLFRISDSHELAEWMIESFKYNLGVHIHTVGDEATRIAVAAAVEARETTYNFGQRIVLAHLQLVQEPEMNKFGEYQIIACVPPLWTGKAPSYFPMEVQFLGKERAEHVYPIKSFLEQNTTIVFHSDYPISPTVSIPRSIFRAMNRYNIDYGIETQRWPEECITRRQALYAMTRNAAYAINEQDRLGTLEIGKIANMTVFDTDFLHCHNDDIPHAELINTIVDGEIVY